MLIRNQQKTCTRQHSHHNASTFQSKTWSSAKVNRIETVAFCICLLCLFLRRIMGRWHGKVTLGCARRPIWQPERSFPAPLTHNWRYTACFPCASPGSPHMGSEDHGHPPGAYSSLKNKHRLRISKSSVLVVQVQQSHTLTRFTAVHCERCFLPDEGFAETWTSTEDFTGVRWSSGRWAVRVLEARPGHRLDHQGGRLAGIGHVHQPLTWNETQMKCFSWNWIENS